jgi:hypothetical protein
MEFYSAAMIAGHLLSNYCEAAIRGLQQARLVGRRTHDKAEDEDKEADKRQPQDQQDDQRQEGRHVATAARSLDSLLRLYSTAARTFNTGNDLPGRIAVVLGVEPAPATCQIRELSVHSMRLS